MGLGLSLGYMDPSIPNIPTLGRKVCKQSINYIGLFASPGLPFLYERVGNIALVVRLIILAGL